MKVPTGPPWATAAAPSGPPVASAAPTEAWSPAVDVVPRGDDAPPWLRALAGLALAALAVVAGIGWRLNDRAAESANRRADDLELELGDATGRLDDAESRLAALEAAAAAEPDLAETAARATPSVFTVTTSTGNGSAWVARVRPGVAGLVTNYHVLEADYEDGVREVDVRQPGRVLRGLVVAVAVEQDLALIEVPEELPALPLTGTGPRVGDSVVVVGSPLGFDQTVVTGIVSAFRDDQIQFSAPISPGNSGGPVLNEAGEVIGVTDQKVVGQGAEGLSFAIPVATLCVTLLQC